MLTGFTELELRSGVEQDKLDWFDRTKLALNPEVAGSESLRALSQRLLLIREPTVTPHYEVNFKQALQVEVSCPSLRQNRHKSWSSVCVIFELH